MLRTISLAVGHSYAFYACSVAYKLLNMHVLNDEMWSLFVMYYRTHLGVGSWHGIGHAVRICCRLGQACVYHQVQWDSIRGCLLLYCLLFAVSLLAVLLLLFLHCIRLHKTVIVHSLHNRLTMHYSFYSKPNFNSFVHNIHMSCVNRMCLKHRVWLMANCSQCSVQTLKVHLVNCVPCYCTYFWLAYTVFASSNRCLIWLYKYV